MILLLPEAKTYFDEQANFLIASLKPLSSRPIPKAPKGSMAHKHLMHLTNADIIGPLESCQIDGFGRLLGFEIHRPDIQEFLPREAADKLEIIAEKVARIQKLGPYFDASYVRNHLVGWVRRRRLKEPADLSWTSDFLAVITHEVCDQTILIPLDGIQIEVPFRLGNVTFDYFTEASIDEILSNGPEGNPDYEYFSEKFRKRYQGRVYAKYQCKAEKNYAQKLAFNHIDKVLDILKLFNPAAFEIRAPCFLSRLGQVTPPQWHAFHASSDGKVNLLSEGVEYSNVNPNFLINKEVINDLRHSGFSIASGLVCKTKPTDLEQRCLEAISHFAHGVASPYPQDRLLHALVAVESLLLRDPSEPIKSHLGYRVALLITSKLEDRKKAKQDFLRGYSLRSQFVHHGAKPDDIQTANRVLLLCWATMNAVMVCTKKYESKLELLNSLEDELLTS